MGYSDEKYINKLLMIKSYLNDKLLYLNARKDKKLTESDKSLRRDILVVLSNLVEKELKEVEQQ